MKFSEYMGSCNRGQVILLGPQRAGKTVLAYSVSHLGKTLGIEAEEGVHAARGYVKPENLEIETVAKKIKSPMTGRWESLPPEKQPPIRERLKEMVMKAYTGGYKYVVVDSLTSIANRFEDEYARTTGTVDLRDWGKIIEGVRCFINDMRNGNFGLVMTAIAGAPKDGSLVEVQPILPGQLRDTASAAFQTIALLTYSKKDKRRKLIVNDPALGCLDRFHAFGNAREVDIEGRPAEIMKTIMEAAMKTDSVDAEEGGVERSVHTVAIQKPAVKSVVRFPGRPVVGRPQV